MSGISPLAVGLGAGAIAAAAIGFGGYQVMDGIGERNPNGNEADKARWVSYGAIGLGVAAGIGGFFLGGRGFNTSLLGAGLIGGGAGAVVGGLAAGWAFRREHGVGVDTEVGDVMGSYNRDFDDELDLDTTWRTPENVRRVSHDHRDSEGHYTHTTYTYYSIDRLTSKANVDGDGKVTRPELRAAVKSYDVDGNDRLKGEELKRYEREVGERSWGGHWF